MTSRGTAVGEGSGIGVREGVASAARAAVGVGVGEKPCTNDTPPTATNTTKASNKIQLLTLSMVWPTLAERPPRSITPGRRGLPVTAAKFAYCTAQSRTNPELKRKA